MVEENDEPLRLAPAGRCWLARPSVLRNCHELRQSITGFRTTPRLAICHVFTYASRYLTSDSDSGRVQLATSTQDGALLSFREWLCQLLRFLLKKRRQTVKLRWRFQPQSVRRGCGDFMRWGLRITHDCCSPFSVWPL